PRLRSVASVAWPSTARRSKARQARLPITSSVSRSASRMPTILSPISNRRSAGFRPSGRFGVSIPYTRSYGCPMFDLDENQPEITPRAEPRSEAEVLDAYSATVIGAVERAGPAVVHIAVAASQGRGGAGSGFIVSADGLIFTNSHVVSGARNIAVSTSDGQRAQARIIGEDPDTDIAVIRSDANLAV